MDFTRLPKDFHCVIEGTSLAQCIFACSLARNGYRVLLLDESTSYGGDDASMALDDLSAYIIQRGGVCDKLPASIPRGLAVDINPAPLVAEGPLIELLINSSICNYVNFIHTDSYLAFRAAPPPYAPRLLAAAPALDFEWVKAVCIAVPNSRESLLTVTGMSLMDKRRTVAFLAAMQTLFARISDALTPPSDSEGEDADGGGAAAAGDAGTGTDPSVAPDGGAVKRSAPKKRATGALARAKHSVLSLEQRVRLLEEARAAAAAPACGVADASAADAAGASGGDVTDAAAQLSALGTLADLLNKHSVPAAVRAMVCDGVGVPFGGLEASPVPGCVDATSPQCVSALAQGARVRKGRPVRDVACGAPAGGSGSAPRAEPAGLGATVGGTVDVLTGVTSAVEGLWATDERKPSGGGGDAAGVGGGGCTSASDAPAALSSDAASAPPTAVVGTATDLVAQRIPAAVGAARLGLFIEASSRFSGATSPLLWPQYGSGDVAQAFAWGCSVFGGVAALRVQVASVAACEERDVAAVATGVMAEEPELAAGGKEAKPVKCEQGGRAVAGGADVDEAARDSAGHAAAATTATAALVKQQKAAKEAEKDRVNASAWGGGGGGAREGVVGTAESVQSESAAVAVTLRTVKDPASEVSDAGGQVGEAGEGGEGRVSEGRKRESRVEEATVRACLMVRSPTPRRATRAVVRAIVVLDAATPLLPLAAVSAAVGRASVLCGVGDAARAAAKRNGPSAASRLTSALLGKASAAFTAGSGAAASAGDVGGNVTATAPSWGTNDPLVRVLQLGEGSGCAARGTVLVHFSASVAICDGPRVGCVEEVVRQCVLADSVAAVPATADPGTNVADAGAESKNGVVSVGGVAGAPTSPTAAASAAAAVAAAAKRRKLSLRYTSVEDANPLLVDQIVRLCRAMRVEEMSLRGVQSVVRFCCAVRRLVPDSVWVQTCDAITSAGGASAFIGGGGGEDAAVGVESLRWRAEWPSSQGILGPAVGSANAAAAGDAATEEAAAEVSEGAGGGSTSPEYPTHGPRPVARKREAVAPAGPRVLWAGWFSILPPSRGGATTDAVGGVQAAGGGGAAAAGAGAAVSSRDPSDAAEGSDVRDRCVVVDAPFFASDCWGADDAVRWAAAANVAAVKFLASHGAPPRPPFGADGRRPREEGGGPLPDPPAQHPQQYTWFPRAPQPAEEEESLLDDMAAAVATATEKM